MIAVAAALALVLGAETQAPPIKVAPGMQQTLHIPGLTRVAIGNPSVADVTLAGGDLLILGKEKGRTSLTLWAGEKETTRVIVVDSGRAAELAMMIQRIVDPDLKVETFNDTVVVMGTLDSLEELQRLKTLVGGEANVKLLVELNPSLLPVIAKQITETFRRNGLAYAEAHAIGDRIVLEGSVADQEEYKKAQMIAESYMPLVGKTP